jgi:hypothetical protein
MSTGFGGLIVAQMIIDDVERQRDRRSARRAERQLAKAARGRRRAGSHRREVGSLDGPRVPAFPEP